MSTLQDLLTYLKERRIHLRRNGETLSIEAPRGVLDRALLEQIKALKSELLEYLSNQTPLRAVERSEFMPLSFAEERIWFLNALQGASPAYNISFYEWVPLDLNYYGVSAAVEAMHYRHESLRTTFDERNGIPFRRIASTPVMCPNFVDLSALDSENAWIEMLRLARAEAQFLFDLRNGPLWRIVCVKIGPHQHIVICTIHHIISDGWSKKIIGRDLMSLYFQAMDRSQHALPELSIQYADYAVWQRERMQGAYLEQELDHWHRILQGVPLKLELPCDYPRRTVPRYRGGTVLIRLDRDTSHTLKQFAKNNNATLFMVLLSLYAIFLERWTRQRDFLIGIPIANRDDPLLSDQIGLLVNTSLVRCRLKAKDTFFALLKTVRESCIEAFSHKDLPFEELVQKLQPRREPGIAPIIQTMFVLQNLPEPDWTPVLTQLNTAIVDTHHSAPPTEPPGVMLGTRRESLFDLMLVAEESGDQIQLAWEYDSDLFALTTVEHWAKQYTTLCRSALAAPETSIYRLSMRAEDEQLAFRKPLLQPDVQLPNEYDVLILFEDQVHKNPDAIALVYADSCLTYRCLSERVRLLAQILQEHEVGPERLVGVFLQRSPQAIVTLLAILKASGAFVPLDPDLPAERLRQLIDDSKPQAFVVSRFEHNSRLQELRAPASAIICLDELSDTYFVSTSLDISQKFIAPRMHPDHLAYIIYTSGSTGRPKGVSVTRHALSTFTQSAIKRYGFTMQDRILQFSTLAFDAAIEEIFGSLCCGATLILKTADAMSSIETFMDHCQHWQPTVLDLPTAFWSMLIRSAQELKLAPHAGLRITIIGGERPDPADAVRFHDWTGGTSRLFNSYGPTESTVVVSVHEVPSVTNPIFEIPLGQALDRVNLSILDAEGALSPQGCPGMLHISGQQLARGYLNAPALTAERFIPDPYSLIPGNRQYRSGDLVRLNPEGNPVYLGRIDRQIKMRGYRIEPEEIEAALLKDSRIRQAALCSTICDGELKLVAYVAATSVTRHEILEHLSAQLPPHMLPQEIVIMDRLPLTVSGKLDRTNLPSPIEIDLETPSTHSLPPQNPIEELVLGIFEEVLGVRNLHRTSDFFDHGGHSLSALRAISRLRQSFSCKLTVGDIFKYPVVKSLAAHLKIVCSNNLHPQRSDTISSALDINPEYLPLSYGEEGVWLLEALAWPHAALNLTFAIPLQFELIPEALDLAFQSLQQRHAALRTTYPLVEGIPNRIVHAHPLTRLRLVDLTTLTESQSTREVERLYRYSANKRFDLENGPLMHCILVRFNRQGYILIFSIHHIAADGWSVQILAYELLRLYRKMLENPNSRGLGETLAGYYEILTLQQRRRYKSDVHDESLGYWLKYLKDIPLRLELNPARPRSLSIDRKTRFYRHLIQSRASAEINKYSRATQATPYMILVSIYGVMLSRLSGQLDLAIGVPVANRDHPESEELVGLYINNILVRIDLRDDPTLEQLIRTVRNNTLDSLTHQDVPFEVLAEKLSPMKDLRYGPAFQAGFMYQNFPELERGNGIPHEFMQASQTLPAFDFSLGPKWSMIDLNLEASPHGDTHELLWEYCSSLFDEATVATLSDCFESLCINLFGLSSLPVSKLQVTQRFECLCADNARFETIGNVEHYLATSPHTDAVVLLEERILQILRDALGTSSIDRETHFVDAAGSSLRTVKLCWLMEQKLSCKLHLADLFRYPTVTAFARFMTSRKKLPTASAVFCNTHDENAPAEHGPDRPIPNPREAC